ncbi:hypothetical protein SLEP1_g43746 [Rubroshorea leprosula]|uniref:Uncharacterized protein n=1 Tax=Rubroshorea leprosula TaxID=152421 RepID=A0AAV5LDZ8_9ROSI|nr:hypothetical protein SLEP1_g43746 [Rubroshorea leprosula]
MPLSSLIFGLYPRPTSPRPYWNLPFTSCCLLATTAMEQKATSIHDHHTPD